MVALDLPAVRLAGTPLAMGRQHGAALRRDVQHNADLLLTRMREELGLSSGTVLRRARVWWERLRVDEPDYSRMVQGIARSSGLPLSVVTALNVRYELMYSEYVRQGLAATACTSFAVLPERARDGGMLIGENWDWIPEVKTAWLNVAWGNLQILGFTEAGIAGPKIGLNSAGVALAVNGLVSHADRWDAPGRPFHVRCFHILRATSFEQAVGAACDGLSPCSACFLVGHGERAVAVERAPDRAQIWEPEMGLLVHANHFLDPDRLGVHQPLAEERESTYLRQARLRKMLEADSRLSPEDVQVALCDHAGYPSSVCRHPDPALPEHARYATRASIVVDLHARRVHYAGGPPCVTRYVELGLG